MIDLRSDTLTRPTAEMRRAMANAFVGDGVIDVDPTVEALEQETARLLAKQAALYMPSGTMSNQVAVRVHCERGSGFLCEAECHIYQYEQGAFAALSGLIAQTVVGDQGSLRPEHLQSLIGPDSDHVFRTRLLCLENTHNRWGGRVIPQSELDAACAWAHEHGLQTHLDGARLWNASVASGLPLNRMAENFDSVSVCFSKGLGAPVGSALVGSHAFIDEARRARKLFGGGMRQAGIVAGGALHAIHCHRERLHLDHEAAQQLAAVATHDSPLSIRGGSVDTNIVVLDVDPNWGRAGDLRDRLYDSGVSCFAIGDTAIRLVTHLDISREQVERACRILQSVTSSAGSRV
ncbi:threonine aldolase family protein [Neorhodopirellula lusitana]|uniref:threonine aldolase family protein n=1 Tax=Neorhodopirellula lusitana TaxID=445327 RepID=UPI00384D532B